MRNIKNNVMHVLANNQVVIEEEESNTFYSYNSCIASYNVMTSVLTLNENLWDYSNTTRKYFKEFINNFTELSFESKKQFLKEIDVNGNIEII